MVSIEPQAAYIGLGSNLGDSLGLVRQATVALDALPQTRLVACSSAYVSAPVDVLDQPDFINAVCLLTTTLAPLQLLQQLLAIEAAHGRQRQGPKGGPRTLDLDLLLYGSCSLHSADLVLPHPRLHERAFVLYPLLELAPDLAIPAQGRVQQLAQACSEQGLRRLPGRLCQGRAGMGEPIKP